MDGKGHKQQLKTLRTSSRLAPVRPSCSPGNPHCSHHGSSPHHLPGAAPLFLLPSPSSSRSPRKNPTKRCFIGKSSCKSEMTLFCPHSRLREFQVEERFPSELHSHCSIVWCDISLLFFPLILHSKELSCAPHLLEHCTSAALAFLLYLEHVKLLSTYLFPLLGIFFPNSTRGCFTNQV